MRTKNSMLKSFATGYVAEIGDIHYIAVTKKHINVTVVNHEQDINIELPLLNSAGSWQWLHDLAMIRPVYRISKLSGSNVPLWLTMDYTSRFGMASNAVRAMTPVE